VVCSKEVIFSGLPEISRKKSQEPEVLDKGSIAIGGIKARGVVNAMRIARESFNNEERAPLSPDYFDRNVSLKVVKVIESYVKIIDKVTWFKDGYAEEGDKA